MRCEGEFFLLDWEKEERNDGMKSVSVCDGEKEWVEEGERSS